MDETYRMLGKEHEADLAREAQNRQLAAQARGHDTHAQTQARRARPSIRPRLSAVWLRVARGSQS